MWLLEIVRVHFDIVRCQSCNSDYLPRHQITIHILPLEVAVGASKVWLSNAVGGCVAFAGTTVGVTGRRTGLDKETHSKPSHIITISI